MNRGFIIKHSDRKPPYEAYEAAEEAAYTALEEFAVDERSLGEIVKDWVYKTDNSDDLHHLEKYQKEMVQDAVMPLIVEGWRRHSDTSNLFTLIDLDYSEHILTNVRNAMAEAAKLAFDKTMAQRREPPVR